MGKYKTIFSAGLLISFLGSLPPGLLNIVAVQVSEDKGFLAALSYAAGATLAEMATVRIVLSGMKWFNSRRYFFSVLEWLTAFVLLLFAGACFLAALSMQDLGKIIPQSFLPPFLTGLLFSLLNPVHFPFWLGWSSFAFSKGSLKRDAQHYNWFIAGIGIGAMAGFLIYIAGGVYLFGVIQQNQYIVNGILGIILLLAALLQVRRMVKIPLYVRYAEVIRSAEKN